MTHTCSHCGYTKVPSGSTNCPVCEKPVVGGSNATSVISSGSGLTGTAYLTNVDGRRFAIKPGISNSIGRQGCDVSLGDPSVPMLAAALVPQGNGFAIRNTSSCTVKVNSKDVIFDIPLQDRDIIQIGNHLLTFADSTAIISKPPQQTPTISSPQQTNPLQHHIPAVSPASFPPPQPQPVTNPSAIPIIPKIWKNPPQVEGRVTEANEPQSWDNAQGQLKRMLGAAVLSMASNFLASIALTSKASLYVSSFRVQDLATGRQMNILQIDKVPRRDMRLGDYVAIWGKVREGNIMLKKAYVYDTDAWTQGIGK